MGAGISFIREIRKYFCVFGGYGVDRDCMLHAEMLNSPGQRQGCKEIKSVAARVKVLSGRSVQWSW